MLPVNLQKNALCYSPVFLYAVHCSDSQIYPWTIALEIKSIVSGHCRYRTEFCWSVLYPKANRLLLGALTFAFGSLSFLVIQTTLSWMLLP